MAKHAGHFQYCACRFCCITAAPMLRGNPISQLHFVRVILVPMNTRAPQQGCISRTGDKETRKKGSVRRAANSRASLSRYGHGAFARLRTTLSSAIPPSNARQSSGQIGRSNNLWLLWNTINPSLAPAPPLGRFVGNTVTAKDAIAVNRGRKAKRERACPRLNRGWPRLPLECQLLDRRPDHPRWNDPVNEPSDYSAASAIVSTDTYLRPSLPLWNRTTPFSSANSV